MNIGDRVISKLGRGYIKYIYKENNSEYNFYIVYIDEPFKYNVKCHRIFLEYELQKSTDYKIGDKVKIILKNNTYEYGNIINIYGCDYGFEINTTNNNTIYIQDESKLILDK